MSRLQKLASDSAVLTSAGSSFHHCGPRTEKSCDFADRPLLALSDGGTRRPAGVVEWRDCAGECGLTFELLQEASGGGGRGGSHGRV